MPGAGGMMRLGGRRFLLSFAIIGAAVCLALGISLPIIRLTKYVFWSTEHSLLSTVEVLIRDGQVFLGLTVLIFSIVLPVLKLLYLLTLCLSPNVSRDFRERSISTMEWLGRYSMTDVLVLALMIFYMNSSGYTEAQVLPGVYCFAASAVMTMIAYGWANTVPARRPASYPSPQPTHSGAPEPQPIGGEAIPLSTHPARRWRT